MNKVATVRRYAASVVRDCNYDSYEDFDDDDFSIISDATGVPVDQVKAILNVPGGYVDES